MKYVFKKQGGKSVITVLLLIVSVLLLVVAGLVYVGKYMQKQEGGNGGKNQKYGNYEMLIKDNIPNEIFNYNAKILEVGMDFLMINVLKKDNLVPEDAIIKAVINQKTSLVKYAQPVRIEPGKSLAELTKDLPQTKLSDFKAGDNIMVYASTNVKDLKEFTASEVRFIK